MLVPKVMMRIDNSLLWLQNGFSIGAVSRATHGSVSSLDLLPLVAPYLKFCIETFGPSRCMFESNFPVDKWGVSYCVLWNTLKRLVNEMGLGTSDKDALFFGTASRVYNLDPQ